MQNSKKVDYFVGLDIGTNSIGYAATDTNYNPLKYQSHPVLGVHLFETAKLAAERRTFRAARRRLDRRQQRIQLLRELFAAEIAKIDPIFFQRIDASSLTKTPDQLPYAIFSDNNYTDKDFYREYPTIHHLIADLIDSEKIHDIRLVYLACAWLLAHRGHFFSTVSKEKIDEITDFSSVYSELTSFIEAHNYNLSWKHLNIDNQSIGEILKSPASRSDRHKQLLELLQVKKKNASSDNDEQWFDESEFLKLLCGLEIKCSKLFPAAKYEDSKLSLDYDDDKTAEMLSALSEDDASLLLAMKKIFDWSVLADIIGDGKNLSSSKVAIYEKHKSDLKNLKYLVKKHLSNQDYREIFRDANSDNYATYCGKLKKDKFDLDKFYKLIQSKLNAILTKVTEDEVCLPEFIADKNIIEQIENDIKLKKFLPKQVTTDNRTIPYQLYWNELNNLLMQTSTYLPFLLEQDSDGLTAKDKILSIMEFRIPYFVGPLNSHSNFAWIKRKADGKIFPWNFEQKVDLDASEEAFISRMTNKCTYWPDAPVLPKNSLLYQKFEVLNIINAIRVNGQPISVDCKQRIYNELFFKYSKISKKNIVSFLISNGFYSGINQDSISGIDDTITASLSSWKIFRHLINEKKLTENDAEEIINQRSFTEDKKRFCSYLKTFSNLDAEDIKWISSQKLQGFGRLSKKFLTEPYQYDKNAGDRLSIINMMWEYNLNLQQLMSDNYLFAKMIKKARKEYYSGKTFSLAERLDDMYVSNAVKRPIIRTLTILDEITRTIGGAPKKIFVEMARDVDNSKKGQRTESRLKKLQDLYRQIANDDTRKLQAELGKYDESALQRDVLYLYFMQLGKDMYTGENITDLSSCNKEHIYPQSKVKDDSIVNNIVLVNSKDNGSKSDSYPVDAKIRQKMTPFWEGLLHKGLITPEKFHRLTRSTPFSKDEKWGFINRQLVETRQSTKAITELLKERYPDSEVVYVKAGLVSDFRHEFNLTKSRTVNDLHHAKDAYLNVVVGNVYHNRFTLNWFNDNHDNHYSVNTHTVFSDMVKRNGKDTVIWQKEYSVIPKTLKQNFIHLTNYAFCQHGGLFDQNPISAKAGLVPLKKDKPTEIYGGYNKSAATFFVFALTEEKTKKSTKKELSLVPVDLLVADKFLKNTDFAVNYVKSFVDPTGSKEIYVHFPLGIKPIKVQTVFEVDNGLRFLLNGKSGGGSQLIISINSPLLLDSSWEIYVKRLESFCEKKKANSRLIYNLEYDKFSVEQNLILYDILQTKLEKGLFAKRPSSPLKCLVDGRDKFITLQPEEQAKLLLGMINLFGRASNAGVDLTGIGGKGKSAVTTLSSNLSNWKKYFTVAHIVYSDASGLHETKSINLLDLI